MSCGVSPRLPSYTRRLREEFIAYEQSIAYEQEEPRGGVAGGEDLLSPFPSSPGEGWHWGKDLLSLGPFPVPRALPLGESARWQRAIVEGHIPR